MNGAIISVIIYLLSWIIFLVALYIVPRNRKPGEATAWLMVIFALPFPALRGTLLSYGEVVYDRDLRLWIAR